MADISKANFDSTDYDLKDQKSRDALVDVVDNGAKNLFDMSGAQTFDVTGYGVHCTINKLTGVITLDGVNQDKKCTGSFNIKIADSTALGLQSGVVYKLNCDGYTTSDTTIGIYVYTSGATPETQFDTYSHTELAWNTAWEQSNGFRLFIRSGTVVNNITLRPMLCTKTEWDISQAYVPYGKTNAELTNDTSTLFTENTRQETEIGVVANAGAKNLLKFRENVTSSSAGNVYARTNSDGTLSVGLTSGTTATAQLVFTLGSITKYRDRKLILSGCPAGGNYQSGYALYVSNNGSTAQADMGSGATLPIVTGVTSSVVALMVRNGTTISSELTFRPMVRDASIVDSTFVPYARTNRELTVENASQQSEINYAVNAGAKSLLPIGVSSITYYSAVTFSVADDGQITVNGTNPNTNNGIVYQDIVTAKTSQTETRYTLPVGTYKITGTGTNGLRFQVHCHDGTNTHELFSKSSDGEFSYTESLKSQYPYICWRILIVAKSSFSNHVVKPMIWDAAITDATFQPYAKTNRELTVENDSQQSEIDYAVNTGVKNLLDVQRPTATTRTSYTPLANGGVELSCSNATWTSYAIADIPVEAGKEYTITFLLDESSGTSNFYFFLRNGDSSGTNLATKNYGSTTGNYEVSFTPSNSVIWLGIYLNNSATAATATAKLRCMIRPAAITDPTFQPYARTNRDLTVLTDEDRASLVELVDGGAKNAYPFGDLSGTGYILETHDLELPAGDYILYIGSITGLKTGEQVQFLFRDGTTNIATPALKLTQTYTAFNLTDSVNKLRVYTNAESNASFTNIMICTKAAWDISHQYEPYAPTNRELYEGEFQSSMTSLVDNLNATYIDKTNSAFVIRKYGKICFARISLKTVTSALTGSDTISSTALPEEFRPDVAVYTPVTTRDVGGWAAGTLGTAAVTIETNGNVVLRTGTAKTSVAYVTGYVSWYAPNDKVST